MNSVETKPFRGDRPARTTDTRPRSKVPHGVFILDRSGSMREHWSNAREAWATFVSEQQALKEPFNLTLILFDYEYTVAFAKVSIGAVQPEAIETYGPRGSTALLDTLGRAMNEHPDDTMFVIFTDGLENASKEFNVKQIREMVTERKTKGSEFQFLSQNLDAIDMGRALGTQAQFYSDHDTLFTAGTKKASASTRSFRGHYADSSSKESA